MRKIWKPIMTLIMVCLTLATLIVPSLAANTPGKIDYAAFGDSVSAGVRGGAGLPGSELASDKGYTDNIADMLQEAGVLGSFDESFCTSGMTARVLSQDTAVLLDPTTDGARLVADAEIATLDIGANDLLIPLYKYYESLKNIADVDLNQAKAILNQMIQDLYTTTGTEVQNDIETVLKNILTANSTVKIYVMGYYNPLPVMSALIGVDLNEPAKYLNTVIQQALQEVVIEYPNASITYVATFDAMAASPKALVSTDIHPTETGYQIIAAEFWKEIGKLVSSYKSSAVPSTSPIAVGGIPIPFTAYNVNGNNYLKIRDIAMALNGTPKQFAISVDGNSINITMGQAYTPVGGELSGNGTISDAAATLSVFDISINGVKANLTAYNINGNNYIKLRDIGQTFNISVVYDPPTNTVNVDVTKAYTPEA